MNGNYKDLLYVSNLYKMYDGEELYSAFIDYLYTEEGQDAVDEFEELDELEQFNQLVIFAESVLKAHYYRTFITDLEETSEANGPVICSIDGSQFRYAYPSLVEVYNDLIKPFINQVPDGVEVYIDTRDSSLVFSFDELDKEFIVKVRRATRNLDPIQWIDFLERERRGDNRWVA